MPVLLHAALLADDTVVITVAGVVAYQSPDQIPGAVRAAIVRWTPAAVRLDVADVSMLDGAGIRALLAAFDVGARVGTCVALTGVGSFLARQLADSGVADLLLQRADSMDATAASAVMSSLPPVAAGS